MTRAGAAAEPGEVDWAALSVRGRWILKHVAVPLALGFTASEVGRRLGVHSSRVTAYMGELRRELVERRPNDLIRAGFTQRLQGSAQDSRP